LYVGGVFSRIGGRDLQGRLNLAALDAGTGHVDGQFATVVTCDAAEQPCDGAVRSLALTHVAVQGGADQPVLFVGGDFSRIGSSEKLVTVGGLAAVWGVDSQDVDAVPMGGELVTAAGTPPPAWVPPLTKASVRTVSVGPLVVGKCQPYQPDPLPACDYAAVYVGGADAGGPLARAFQFKIDPQTWRPPSAAVEEFTSWKASPGPAGCAGCVVESMLLVGSSVVFGGDFTKAGDPAVDVGHVARIAAVDPTDTWYAVTPATASRFGDGVNGTVRALAGSGGRVLAAVTDSTAGDVSERVLALDPSSGAPIASESWVSPAPDSPVTVVATSASTSSVFVGGEFRSVDAKLRRGLAAFGAAGALLDWAPDLGAGGGLAPRVHALVADAGTVYVGGQFDALPGPGGGNLVAVDGLSGQLRSGLVDVTSAGGPADVLSLALSGSGVYVGGSFDHVGGQPRSNLAALDTATGAVSTGFVSGVTGGQAAVRAILPACGAVYVGGFFDRAGGQPRSNLAALDPQTGDATGWDPGPDGTVLALARSGPVVYAGGTFSRIDGTERQRLAALDAFTGHLTAFDASIDAQSLGGAVRALAVTDSALYVGGHFAGLGSEQRFGLAAVDPGSGQALGWDPRPDGRIDALAVGDDGVVAGGTFSGLGATAQRGLATFAGAGGPASAACGAPASSAVAAAPVVLPGPPADSGSALRPRVVLAVLKFKIAPPVFRVALPARYAPKAKPGMAPAGTTLRFAVTKAARVKILLERELFGRRQGKQCVAARSAHRQGRRCTRYQLYGTLKRTATRGENAIAFSGMLGKKALPAGLYTAKLVATELNATRTVAKLARFQVVGS
jgi:hypothetical protein